jgi:hypothetical protein
MRVDLDDPAKPRLIQFRRNLSRVVWWTFAVAVYVALYCAAIMDTDWFTACGLANDVVHPEETEYTVTKGRGSSVIQTGVRAWEWMQDFDCIWYLAAGACAYVAGYVAWVTADTMGRTTIARLLDALTGLLESALLATATGTLTVWLAGTEMIDYLIEVGWVVKRYEPERTERVIPWWSWLVVALGVMVVYMIVIALGLLLYRLHCYLLPQVIQLPDVTRKARGLAAMVGAPPDLVMKLMRVRIPLPANGHLRQVLLREYNRWCEEHKVSDEDSLHWACLPDWVAADVSLSKFHLDLASVNDHGVRVRETDDQTGAGVGLYAVS